MAMKVFNLTCELSHVFEGWFASLEAFGDQSRRRLIACPVCGSTDVTKMLSAPRLNLGASEPPAARGTAAAAERAAAMAAGRPGVRLPGGPQGTGLPAAAAGRTATGEAGRGPADQPPGESAPLDPVQVQQVFLAMARKLIESTEDVGDRFVTEARKIHYDEAPSRAIRGSATREEAAELHEEGIEVFALPVPESLKGPLQ